MLQCYQPIQRWTLANMARFALCLVWLLPILLSGCMALSIPSVRYHDPEDRGGLLGPQRPAHPTEDVTASGEQVFVEDIAESSACMGCGDESCDDGCEGSESERPPEVPWPRFHPLPTRPVFSR